MSLGRVIWWRNGKPQHCARPEAVYKEYSRGISAWEKVLQCDCCNKWVLMAAGRVRDPYFKHSPADNGDYCEDRTVNASTIAAEKEALSRALVMCLREIGSGIELRLGLSLGGFRKKNSVSANSLQKVKMQIYDTSVGKLAGTYDLSNDRIIDDGRSYFPIAATKPDTNYAIRFISSSDAELAENLKSYFGDKRLDGCVCDRENFFDGVTGLRLTSGAKVYLRRKYYVLSRKRIRPNVRELLSCNEQVDQSSRWFFYSFELTKISKDLADYFAGFDIGLQDNPLEIVWPSFRMERDCFCVGQSSVYIWVRSAWGTEDDDNIPLKVFPACRGKKRVSEYRDDIPVIYKMECRNQLQSILLSGLYANYESPELHIKIDEQPNRIETLPEIKVTHGLLNKEQIFERGEHNELPKRKLNFSVPYTGSVVQSVDGGVVQKWEINDEKPLSLSVERFGTRFDIYQGMDLVWSAWFKEPDPCSGINEDDVIRRLDTFNGDFIGYTAGQVGNLLKKLEHYPKIRHWVIQRLKSGKISRKAKWYLVKVFM